MELSERIGMLRRQAGMTVEELAERSGVAKGTLNKIIGGVTKNPTVSVAGDIARALGVGLEELLGREGTAAPVLSREAAGLARDFDGLDDRGAGPTAGEGDPPVRQLLRRRPGRPGLRQSLGGL